MKENIIIICSYILNVLVIAIPLAVLELWLEKFKTGWGGEFRSRFWGKKLYFKVVLKVAEKTYISVYHLVMFAVILPGIFVFEFLVLWHLSKSGSWVLNVYDVRFVPIIFLPTVWLGNSVTEDFLYFVIADLFSWRFPGALKRFFNGECKWHTHYVKLSNSIKLPRFYLTVPIYIVVLLIVHSIFIHVV